ncbi:hypothetical protein HY469_05875 [Candidatus Roizmanbacteria bacterium]|nr:hypothetical protein [Candidatus Roizmanbacteria bacterium]
MIINKINILSAGKIAGATYFLFGLIFGIFISLFSFIGAGFSDEPGAGVFGALFGGMAIILLPLMYGAMGFIGGIIGAALYNLIARYMGGLEIEVTQK